MSLVDAISGLCPRTTRVGVAAATGHVSDLDHNRLLSPNRVLLDRWAFAHYSHACDVLSLIVHNVTDFRCCEKCV